MAQAKGTGWVFLLCLFTAASLMEVSAAGSAQAFMPLFIEHELGVAAEDVPRWTGVLERPPTDTAWTCERGPHRLLACPAALDERLEETWYVLDRKPSS